MARDVIGRESELAILHRFLDSIPTGPSALLLSGDPGIGKTTVWKEGLAGAPERGHRTLSCSPVEAETRLSYTVLGDLIEPVLDEVWDTGKLEAMEGPVLAESVGSHGYALWDAGKLEAMAGRGLAETVAAERSATLWDAGKLEAMKGRVLAG